MTKCYDLTGVSSGNVSKYIERQNIITFYPRIYLSLDIGGKHHGIEIIFGNDIHVITTRSMK